VALLIGRQAGRHGGRQAGMKAGRQTDVLKADE